MGDYFDWPSRGSATSMSDSVVSAAYAAHAAGKRSGAGADGLPDSICGVFRMTGPD